VKFEIEAKRTRVLMENIKGTIDISKKEVMRVTDCPSVEDGDSTAWYSYVEEAVELGANFKLDIKVKGGQLQGEAEYTDVEINW